MAPFSRRYAKDTACGKNGAVLEFKQLGGPVRRAAHLPYDGKVAVQFTPAGMSCVGLFENVGIQQIKSQRQLRLDSINMRA